MIIMYVFGSCIGYIIILTELLQYVCSQTGMDKDFVESMEFRAIVGIPLTALIMFPLSLLRDMNALRYAGLASIVAMAYTGIVLIVEAPFYYQQNVEKATIYWEYFDLNFFTSCSITFFAYTC